MLHTSFDCTRIIITVELQGFVDQTTQVPVSLVDLIGSASETIAAVPTRKSLAEMLDVSHKDNHSVTHAHPPTLDSAQLSL